MKVRIARKATKGQQKRWKRGMSSSSNPETRKYRSQVNSLTSPLTTNNNRSQSLASQRLTEEALLRHNALGFGLKNLTLGEEDDGVEGLTSAMQRAPSIASSDENFEVQSFGPLGIDLDAKSTKSNATFASVWSNCTNASFGKLLNNWRANSLMHKEMLAVLSAVAEAIRENGGKETETEYFAALMTTLEAIDSDETLAATISLISMVMRRLPASVLKAKFAETSKILVDLLNKYAATDHVGLLRNLINCLCVLLRAQEQAVWQLTSTHQIYRALLVFLGHPKPTVRRSAHKAILSILKGSPWITAANANQSSQPDSLVIHPMASETAEFCIKEIEQTKIEDDFKHTLIMVNVVKDLFSTLPQNSVKAVCEMLLRLMTLGNVLIVTCSLQAFYHLFVSRPNAKSLPKELNANIITALYGYQPSLADHQPLCAWLTVMREAFGNYYNLSPQACVEHLPKMIEVIVSCYESDGPQVQAKCNELLKYFLLTCVRPTIGELPLQDTYKSIYALIERLLSYQFSHAWTSAFAILPCLVRVFGPHHPALVSKTIQDLSEMRENPDFNLKPQLDRVVGTGVRVLGPQAVLSVIPLKLDQGSSDLSKSWLIPVIRDYTRGATLSFYIRFFMALINQLQARQELASKHGHMAEAKVCEILIDQIWSLLPSFSRKPTDIVASFKNIARTLGTTLSDRPALRMHVLSALVTLIKDCPSDEARQELSRYAKNFLPILFNLYTNSKDELPKEQRAAIYLTIQTYLTITDQALVKTMLSKVIEKFKNAEPTDRLLPSYLLDLMRSFVPHIEEREVLDNLFQEVVDPLIAPKTSKNKDAKASQNKNHDKVKARTEEKKGWKVVEAICKSSTPVCRKFIEDKFDFLLSAARKAYVTCNQPAKLSVLRTLAIIIEHRPEKKLCTQKSTRQFLELFLPSLVKSLLKPTSRLRTAVLNMTDGLVDLLKIHNPTAAEELATMLMELAAKESTSPQEIAIIISLLAHIMHQHCTEFTPQARDTLARYILAKTSNDHRPVVQAVIDGVKTLLKCMPKDKYLPYLEITVKGLTSMKEELNRHFRFQIKELLVKLVRRYGADIVGKMTPESHSKMLRNIRKVETRKVRMKKAESEKSKSRSDDQSSWGEDKSMKSYASKSTRKLPEGIDEILADSSEDELLDDTDDRDDYPKGKLRQPDAWIEEDVENDEVLDLSDAKKTTRKILSVNPFKKKVQEQQESKVQPFPMTEDGKIVIAEDDYDPSKSMKRKMDSDDDEDSENENATNTPFDDATVFSALSKYTATTAKSKATSFSSMSYRTGGRGIHRDPSKAKEQDPGAEYRSKKAGGDMKRRGKPDPYAYIPLDRRSLNKRKAKKMAGQFNTVVRSAKRGASLGSKQRSKKSGKNFAKRIKTD